MIDEYMKKVQRILGDPIFERFNPYDLLDYINEARGVVASLGECVRVLCPSTAGIAGATVTAGGTGYTSAPTVTISSPQNGVQATAYAIIVSHAVVQVVITNAGTGYAADKVPSISFSGGGGTGAAATAVLLPCAQTTAAQETYKFTDFNDLVRSSTVTPGASMIIAVRSVAVSWGSMKPTLRSMAWGDFQAYLRAFNSGAQGFPKVWAQYARGTTGSFQLWPIPSAASQMDLDCICIPQDLDLQSDATAEAIPYPYTNAVPYKAAELAVYGETDLRDLADRYAQRFDARMQSAAATTLGATIPDYYASAARL